MTSHFKLALGVSVGVHAAVLIGLPLTSPVAFDVERGPASVELYLVSQPKLQPEPRALSPEPVEPEPAPVIPAPEEPTPQTVVATEHPGAIAEHLPAYLRNPPPIYPERARQRGEEGTVLIEVEVLSSGRCGTVNVVQSSGVPELDQAAVQAIRRWVFRPARRWHQPVAFWVEIPITFRLLDNPRINVSP